MLTVPVDPEMAHLLYRPCGPVELDEPWGKGWGRAGHRPALAVLLTDGLHALSLQRLMERQKRKADIEKGLQFIQ